MGASGLLVFDDEPIATTVQDETGRAFVILEDTNDILVFDSEPARLTQDSSSSTDFIVFDADVTVTETVVAPADFVLVDPPKGQTQVVLEGTLEDVLVLTPGGPPGPAGDTGPQGPPGEPGMDGAGAYYQVFAFAVPSTLWTIVHNQDTFGLNVETVDTNGDGMEGYVQFPDANTITIEFYYPTAGQARVFR